MEQTFKDFLLEKYENPQKYIDTLNRDCAPFLRDVGGMANINEMCIRRPPLGVLRGMNTATDTFLTKEVRAGRTPVDTSKEMHVLMDNWFNDKFGHRYRSNSIFASPRISQARAYGNVYMIFPIGEYKVCSSPKVRDLFNLTNVAADKGVFNYDDTYEEGVIKWLDVLGYKQGPVTEDVFHTKTEMMIACKSYHALNLNDWRKMIP